MKLAVYFFIIAQILNFLGAFAEKVIKSSSKFDSVKWEKVKENKSKTLKKIIWKSYKNDKSDLENKIFKNKPKKNQEKTEKETSTWRNRILRFSFEEIDMPDAGEHMGLYSMGLTIGLILGFTEVLLFTVPQADNVVDSLLVVIPWVWNIG